MGHPRVLITTVCDDVRQEVGKKMSLMGIYDESMLLPQFPITLPKLCFVLRAITDTSNPFRKLSFSVLRDDDVLVESTIEQESLEASFAAINNQPLPPSDKGHIQTFVLIAQVAPLALPKECTLRFEAQTESEMLRGATIRVIKAPQVRAD